MPLGSDYAGQSCALARALEILGERWTLLIEDFLAAQARTE
jgi:DNA-binding HxlR family transcriptional regulator